MNWQRVLDFLNIELVQIGGTPVTIASTATMVIAFVVASLMSRLIRAALVRALRARDIEAEGTIGSFLRLGHYLILLVGLGVGLQTVGIKLSALFAAGAVVAVGVGFAMQNIAQNFVSGVILLVERSIKPGDILDLDGELVRVREMGIRSTIVRTLYEEDLIVPNSALVQASVKNHTLGDSTYRLTGTVGVSYDTNLDEAMAALERAGTRVTGRLATQRPLVLLKSFGASSVDFEVSVWIDRPWEKFKRRSELLLAIWDELHAAGIVIAFPQLDVHLDRGPVLGTAEAA